MRDFESALKAAGDPTRTRILKLLEARELCVCQIQAVLGLAPSTVSKHLAILKMAGLVDDQRDGRWIHYALATEGHNPHAAGVLSLLRGALDRDPMIVADRRRLKKVLGIPLGALCRFTPVQGLGPAPAGRKGRASQAAGGPVIAHERGGR